MAEKKSAKQTSNDEPLRPEKSESPADYLARAGVTRQMQDVVSSMLENRPEDPLAFIADYFANVADHQTSITQAHKCLCLSHYNKPAFQSNLLKAYSILNRQKCGHGIRGLVGKTYNELLTLLCRDIPSNECDNLLKLLCKREQEVVRFHIFNSGVKCCLVFKDFLKQANSLFQELDLSGRDETLFPVFDFLHPKCGRLQEVVTQGGYVCHADHVLCDAMLSQLSQTVSHESTSSLSILEAGVCLSSQNVDIAMKKALADSFTHNTGETMTSEEFVHQACEIFLAKVPAAENQ